MVCFHYSVHNLLITRIVSHCILLFISFLLFPSVVNMMWKYLFFFKHCTFPSFAINFVYSVLLSLITFLPLLFSSNILHTLFHVMQFNVLLSLPNITISLSNPTQFTLVTSTFNLSLSASISFNISTI